MNHNEITSFIRGVTDLNPRHLQARQYQDVILPLTVPRRLDCSLAPTKSKVLAVYAKYRGRIEDHRTRVVGRRTRLYSHVAEPSERLRLFMPAEVVVRVQHAPSHADPAHEILV